jgi:hypothetical protein
MRLVAALSVAALSLAASPAEAQWNEYVFEELGIAKQFPAPPKETRETYQTPQTGRAVPARVLSVELDNILYRMLVADLSTPDLIEKSAQLYAECIARAEQEGKVIAAMPQRVEDGTPYDVYGQLTSVELAGNAGRKQTNCFYTKGRLYRIEALVRPAHGQPTAPETIRFTSSFRFALEADAPR